LDSLRDDFFHQLRERADTLEKLNELRVAWLGRSGQITQLLKQLGALSIEQKKILGPQYNGLKEEIAESIEKKEQELRRAERSREFENDTLDISLPGTPYLHGRLHPLSLVTESLVSIFRSLGFVCADGPEMESEFYNFEALNVPADHPARDMQDTFYLEAGAQQLTLPQLGADGQGLRDAAPPLLRTHTSPVQVHVMQAYPPPIAIICPGRVYRHEAVDATHASVFHQMEGLMVDEGLSFADLKGTLARFAQLFFAPSVKTRFRPSFFPFTEPSAQMDVSCMACSGALHPSLPPLPGTGSGTESEGDGGCRTCRGSGWIELLGAGMVNPNVFKYVNIDPEKYSGFAFGMGIERLALIKYGIGDLRLFTENDVRFLQQF